MSCPSRQRCLLLQGSHSTSEADVRSMHMDIVQRSQMGKFLSEVRFHCKAIVKECRDLTAVVKALKKAGGVHAGRPEICLRSLPDSGLTGLALDLCTTTSCRKDCEMHLNHMVNLLEESSSSSTANGNNGTTSGRRRVDVSPLRSPNSKQQQQQQSQPGQGQGDWGNQNAGDLTSSRAEEREVTAQQQQLQQERLWASGKEWAVMVQTHLEMLMASWQAILTGRKKLTTRNLSDALIIRYETKLAEAVSTKNEVLKILRNTQVCMGGNTSYFYIM